MSQTVKTYESESIKVYFKPDVCEHAAEYARDENKFIIPVCPYAKSVLESKADYQSVLAN